MHFPKTYCIPSNVTNERKSFTVWQKKSLVRLPCGAWFRFVPELFLCVVLFYSFRSIRFVLFSSGRSSKLDLATLFVSWTYWMKEWNGPKQNWRTQDAKRFVVRPFFEEIFFFYTHVYVRHSGVLISGFWGFFPAKVSDKLSRTENFPQRWDQVVQEWRSAKRTSTNWFWISLDSNSGWIRRS